MKRVLALGVAVAALAVAGVLVEQRVERDRQYRDLVASGESRLAAGDTAMAIEAFSGALALRDGSMVAHLRRGEAYRADHRLDDAARDLTEAARLAPDSTAPALALGDLYDSQHDWARAANWYSQAASRLGDPSVFYKLALARLRAGSAAAAIDPLQHIVATEDSGPAYYLLGLAYRDTHRIDDATRALEHAVRIAPWLLEPREELADLYRSLNRPTDEMAQLQALAGLDARPARAVDVALAETRAGQLDSSVATLADAAHNDPTNPAVALALTRVFLARAERTLDRPSALRAMTLLTTPPLTAQATSERLALMGRAQYLSGDWAPAERTLTTAVRTAPVDIEAFGFLADAAERLGHDTAALDALANLDALVGDTAPTAGRAARAHRMGAIALRLNDLHDAAVALETAVDLGDTDASTLALLAQAEWQTGDRAAARSHLARAAATDAHNADVLRVERLLR